MARHFPIDVPGHDESEKQKECDAKQQGFRGQAEAHVEAAVLQGDAQGSHGHHGQNQPVHPYKSKPNHRQHHRHGQQGVLFPSYRSS